MGWDESFFKTAHSWVRTLATRGKKPSSNAVFYDDIKDRLCFFARLVAARPIEIAPSDTEGSYTSQTLLLPKIFDLAESREDNVLLYLNRILYSLTLMDLVGCQPSSVNLTQRIDISLSNRDRVIGRLQSEYPGFSSLQNLVEKLISKIEASSDNRLKNDFLHKIYGASGFSYSDDSTQAQQKISPVQKTSRDISTEIKASHQDVVELIQKPKEVDENPVIHAFEKVQTVDEYQGGNKNLDGEDELSEQADALNELGIKHVIRTTERSQSIYKADIQFHTMAPDFHSTNEYEETGRSFRYDEWHEAKREFRKDWCLVTEREPKLVQSNDAETQTIASIRTRQSRAIQELKSLFANLINQRQRINRQIDGDDICIDSVIDFQCARLAHANHDERFYIQKIKRTRDVATLILIDSSLSSDSFINNHRVLDVIKDAVVVLSEVFCKNSDQFSVAAFHSHTRHKCTFDFLKRFEESWQKGSHKLVRLEPEGYTRIGPAIRHATKILEGVDAQKKLLLLISDGKATDYDRYEGSYGLADVRQALESANTRGVQTFALATTSDAKFYLPLMFGRNNYSILSTTQNLASTIFSIYKQII